MLPMDLSPCSFRGVGFLCPKDSLSEGRRTIDHMWPDSNQRYAEDNGYIPPEFTISAILTGPNLPAKVAALRNALNTPGPGTLRHPWAGVKRCAVKGPHKIERDDSDANVVRFEICFLQDNGAIFPAIASGIPAVVAGLASSTIASIASAFPAAFGIGAITAASRVAIGGQVAVVGSALSNAFGVAQASTTLVRAAQSIADQPERLAASIATAVALPFDGGEFTDSQLVSGFRSVADAAGAVVLEAQTFAARVGV